MKLKEWWHRFRLWQRRPISYKPMSDENHKCLNCGQEYVGDYCPRCSQSAKVGNHIGWDAISESYLDIFTIGSRSILRTIWHLLFRPGHLIGDYISGHRNSSYPPLKLLLYIAFVSLIIDELIESLSSKVVSESSVSAVVKGDVFDNIVTWLAENPGWAILMLSSLFIWPTWILFRYAPRHTRHTLPEGFFIQVFMSTLILIIVILYEFLFDWWLLLIPIYYMAVYRQLFGYGLWGTLWRITVGTIETLLTALLIMSIIITSPFVPDETRIQKTSTELIAIALFVILGAIPLFIAHKINTRSNISDSPVPPVNEMQMG